MKAKQIILQWVDEIDKDWDETDTKYPSAQINMLKRYFISSAECTSTETSEMTATGSAVISSTALENTLISDVYKVIIPRAYPTAIADVFGDRIIHGIPIRDYLTELFELRKYYKKSKQDKKQRICKAIYNSWYGSMLQAEAGWTVPEVQEEVHWWTNQKLRSMLLKILEQRGIIFYIDTDSIYFQYRGEAPLDFGPEFICERVGSMYFRSKKRYLEIPDGANIVPRGIMKLPNIHKHLTRTKNLLGEWNVLWEDFYRSTYRSK